MQHKPGVGKNEYRIPNELPKDPSVLELEEQRAFDELIKICMEQTVEHTLRYMLTLNNRQPSERLIQTILGIFNRAPRPISITSQQLVDGLEGEENRNIFNRLTAETGAYYYTTIFVFLSSKHPLLNDYFNNISSRKAVQLNTHHVSTNDVYEGPAPINPLTGLEAVVLTAEEIEILKVEFKALFGKDYPVSHILLLLSEGASTVALNKLFDMVDNETKSMGTLSLTPSTGTFAYLGLLVKIVSRYRKLLGRAGQSSTFLDKRALADQGSPTEELLTEVKDEKDKPGLFRRMGTYISSSMFTKSLRKILELGGGILGFIDPHSREGLLKVLEPHYFHTASPEYIEYDEGWIALLKKVTSTES